MHAQTNGKVSDGSQVPKTGYELIRSRKRKGKLATMADYAKIDFQPWKDEGKKPGDLRAIREPEAGNSEQ
jgi:hypothetical protein